MARWVVVRHRADDGGNVRFNVRRAGFDVHWPRLWERRPRRDDVARPLFGGYMFARLDAGQSWGPILRVRNVLGVLSGGDGAPIPVPDGTVEKLIERAGGAIDGIINTLPDATHARMMPGTRLAVLSGPFTELEAVLTKDAGARVQVLLQILGGDRIVQLPRDAVAPVPTK